MGIFLISAYIPLPYTAELVPEQTLQKLVRSCRKIIVG